MTLPAELLTVVEAHACFSGCYTSGDVTHCVVPGSASVVVEDVFSAECTDCLYFRVGTTSALAPGSDKYSLANDLTAHMQALRGYALSFGGYHTQGGGFWLSAAYWATPGIFVLDAGSRGSSTAPPLDRLVRAFTSGVAKPPHPAMMDPKSYVTHDAYLNMSAVGTGPSSVAALLASPAASTTRKKGFVHVTLAEFLPVASAPKATSIAAPSEPQAPSAPPAIGERCDRCGAVVEERELFSSTYIGCLC